MGKQQKAEAEPQREPLLAAWSPTEGVQLAGFAHPAMPSAPPRPKFAAPRPPLPDYTDAERAEMLDLAQNGHVLCACGRFVATGGLMKLRGDQGLWVDEQQDRVDAAWRGDPQVQAAAAAELAWSLEQREAAVEARSREARRHESAEREFAALVRMGVSAADAHAQVSAHHGEDY